LPPPPPVFHGQTVHETRVISVCVKCNASSTVQPRSFKHFYVPPIAYIAMVLGPLIGALLVALLRVQHEITLPYCDNCWRRMKQAKLLEGLSLLSFFAALIGGVVLMLNVNSGYAFWLPMIASVAFIVFAQRHKRSIYPKFKKIDRKQV